MCLGKGMGEGRGSESGDGIELFQESVQWLAVTNTGMNLRAS